MGFRLVRVAVEEVVELAGLLQLLTLAADVAVQPADLFGGQLDPARAIAPGRSEVPHHPGQQELGIIPVPEDELGRHPSEQAYRSDRIDVAAMQDQLGPASA